MSGVYSVEDLLKLRASPLIVRPPNLPPIEEWMGSQDQPNKRPATRGRQEEGSLHPDGFQKRPAFDSAQRRSTTDPDRIILGPPRRSFASSSGRPFGKNGNQESEDTSKDRSDELGRLGDGSESRVGERRGFGGLHSRHGNRQDRDSPYNESPRRRNDEDDADGRPRRDYDRSKWGSKDSRVDKGLEDPLDEGGNARSGFRRDQPRGKFDQPWFRGDRPGDEQKRENERGPGWRNSRNRDGEWDNPGKQDMDPEWMDTADATEPFQAHTQEDFQRWKERMKAGNSTADGKGEKAIPAPEATLSADTATAFAAPPSNLISPDPSGNSMDKFFARFSEKKGNADDKPSQKPAAKTRFASIFSPQAETKPEPNALLSGQPASLLAPNITPAISPDPQIGQAQQLLVDPDQAGFQRILQMLGKRENGTKQSSDGSNPKASNNIAGSAHQRHASPDLVALFKQDHSARQTPISQPPAAPPGLERLLDSRSPAQTQTHHTNTPNKDESLLNLLRQADISAKPQPQQPYSDNRGLASIFGIPEGSRNEGRPRSDLEGQQGREKPAARGMFDDPAISSMSYQDEMRARENMQRRAANGIPPGFDEGYLDHTRTHVGHPQAAPNVPSSVPNMPPGLQRPPGLDQLPRMPSGWSQQPGPPGPPPSQGRPGPPPGLGARGPPPFGNPQQPPMLQPMPNQGPQRPAPQRKYTGDSSMPNFPPGMGPPPPGFMTHGPPPGFQHASAAHAAQNYGRFGMGGNEQPVGPPGPPPNVGRNFMDMFGGDERGGIRGGNGVSLPPGFR